MSVKTTSYQRIFHHNLFSPPIRHRTRNIPTTRSCNDRLCLLISVLLLTYIGWYIFISSNRIYRHKHDRAEEFAYKNAIKTSSSVIENKQLCSLDKVHLVFVIISKRSHSLERQSIRDTWGSMPDIFGVHSQRLFVIGYDSFGTYYKELVNEAKHEQDILYLTVNDSSMTLKELYAYRWLEKYCSDAKYVFKTEDDLFVNSLLIHEVVRELNTGSSYQVDRYLYNISLNSLLHAQKPANANKFLFGWAYQPGRPERNSTSPFYVSYETYSNEFYPHYCSGFGYLMNSQTRNSLTEEGLKANRKFRFSDVFITGILAENLNFTCESLPFTFFQGITDKCIELIEKNNRKIPSASASPVIICSTGLQIGRNSYSDYYKLWKTLKNVYTDRLDPAKSKL